MNASFESLDTKLENRLKLYDQRIGILNSWQRVGVCFSNINFLPYFLGQT